MPSEATTPLYFGSPGGQLFGCHHAAVPGSSSRTGIVLCCPLGHEYIQFHRCLAQFGMLLSRAGFPVLRFDYSGCGDSSGACEEGGIERWLVDVACATEELKRLEPGIESVLLVGLRLGASLAVLAGAERGDVERVVLLDPVVSGAGYLAELIALHRDVLRYAHIQPDSGHRLDESREVLGFPLTEGLSRELGTLDLLATERRPASRALLVQSDPRADYGRLRDHLERLGVQVDYVHVPSPEIWAWTEDYGKLLVPFKVLQAVVSWVGRP